MVSTAKTAVIAAATAETAANAKKTWGRSTICAGVSRAPIIIPTVMGPMIEASRSHAVAVPTPSARTRSPR